MTAPTADDLGRIEALPLEDIVGELRRRRDVVEREIARIMDDWSNRLPDLRAQQTTLAAMLVAAGAYDAEEAAPGPARESDPPPDPAPASSSPPAEIVLPPLECGCPGDGDCLGHAAPMPDEPGAPPPPTDRRVRTDRRASDEAVAAVLAATPAIWTQPVEILKATSPPIARATFRRAITQLVETGQVESNGERTQRRRYRRVSIETDTSPASTPATDASPAATATDTSPRAADDVSRRAAATDDPSEASPVSPTDATGPGAPGPYQTPSLPPARSRLRPVGTDRAGHAGAHGTAVSARVRREIEREEREAAERAKEPAVEHEPDSLEGRILAQLDDANLPISTLSRRLDESGAVIAMSVRELEREGRIERMQDGKYRRIAA